MKVIAIEGRFIIEAESTEDYLDLEVLAMSSLQVYVTPLHRVKAKEVQNEQP